MMDILDSKMTSSHEDSSRIERTRLRPKNAIDAERRSIASIYTYRSMYATGSEDVLNNKSVQSLDSSISVESSKSAMIEKLIAERLKLGFIKVTDQVANVHETDVWDIEEEEEEFEEDTPSDIKLCYKIHGKKVTAPRKVTSGSESMESNLVFPTAEGGGDDSDADSCQDPSKDLLMMMHRRRSTYTPTGYQPATPQFKQIEKQSRLQWTPLTKPSQRYVRFLFEEALAPMNNIKLFADHIESTSEFSERKAAMDSSEEDLVVPFSLDNLMKTIDLAEGEALDQSYTKDFKYTPWWALPDTKSTESVRAIRHIFKTVSDLKVSEIEIKQMMRSNKEKKLTDETDVVKKDVSLRSLFMSSDDDYALKEESCYFLRGKESVESVIQVIQEPVRLLSEFDIQKKHKKSVESLQAVSSSDSVVDYRKKSVRFSKRQLFGRGIGGELTGSEEGPPGVRRKSRVSSDGEPPMPARSPRPSRPSMATSDKSKETTTTTTTKAGSDDDSYSNYEWEMPEETVVQEVIPEEKLDLTSSSSSESYFGRAQDDELEGLGAFSMPKMDFFHKESGTKSLSLSILDKRRTLNASLQRHSPDESPLKALNVKFVSYPYTAADGTTGYDNFRFVDKRPKLLPLPKRCKQMNPESPENMVQMYKCLSERENLPVFERIVKSFKTRNAHYERLGRVPPGVMKAASKVLEYNTKLRRFNLTGQALTDDDLHHLTKAMENMPRLQRLKMSYAGLNSENVQLLAGCINLFDDLCVLDLSHNKIGDKGLLALFTAVESLPTVANLRLADNQLTVGCFEGLKIILNRDNKISALDLSWNKINDGTELLNFAKMLKEGDTVLKELHMGWNSLQGVDAATAFLLFASLKEFFYLDISNNEFAHVEEVKIFNQMLKESPALKYFIMSGNPLDEGMDWHLLFNLEWDHPATLRLIDLGDHWFLKETVHLCNKYRERHKIVVKIANILDNADVTHPDMREAYIKRIQFLNSVKGRKRKPVNLGKILLKMQKDGELGEMKNSAFRKLLESNNFILDDDLDLLLGRAFSKRKHVVDMEAMLEMWMKLFPNTGHTKKGRRGRKKKGGAGGGKVDESQEASAAYDDKQVTRELWKRPEKPHPYRPSKVNYEFVSTLDLDQAALDELAAAASEEETLQGEQTSDGTYDGETSQLESTVTADSDTEDHPTTTESEAVESEADGHEQEYGVIVAPPTGEEKQTPNEETHLAQDEVAPPQPQHTEHPPDHPQGS